MQCNLSRNAVELQASGKVALREKALCAKPNPFPVRLFSFLFFFLQKTVTEQKANLVPNNFIIYLGGLVDSSEDHWDMESAAAGKIKIIFLQVRLIPARSMTMKNTC